MENKNLKMWLGGALAVVILAVAAWFLLASPAAAPVQAPEAPAAAVNANDTTASINSDLNNVNVPDPAQDIQGTSADVNKL